MELTVFKSESTLEFLEVIDVFCPKNEAFEGFSIP
jgi:hypothetical protein